MPSDSTPFEDYVAPARTRPEVWRLVLGLLLGLGVYAGGLVLYFSLLGAVVGVPSASWLVDVATRSERPFGTLVLLGSFAAMVAGPLLMAPMLHQRGIGTLIGPLRQALRDFGRVALCTAAVQVAALLFWVTAYDVSPNVDFGLWAMLLPLSLAGVLLQTGAEELVFRGYIMQQLAARFCSPMIWGVLPAVGFGLLHRDPAMGSETWHLVFATGIFALIATDLTVRTGTLGAAWGLHFTNNAGAILILSTEGNISGLSLFTTPYLPGATGWQVVFDCFALLVAWRLARRFLAR
ncbi:lysostaphin resistance A-like protein [Psychromarinibacter sp. S121]|uniref:CPBP family intramembrane glutamic endopeptidase n=1 Tax=Psychromarinibacter sp. S121 TaxID=3415127 RepID=UPI003C7D9B7E